MRTIDPGPDRALLQEWLERPHVREWWGAPADALALLIDCAPRSAAILRHGRRDIGCACWQALSPGDRAIIGLPPADDRAITDIDFLIGEPDALGKGGGAIFLHLILDRIRESDPLALAGLCIAADNEASLRAALRAGFQKEHSFEDPEDGLAWFLINAP